MKLFLQLFAEACLLGAAPASAATLIPVPPVPGSVATVAFGINDNNVIAGGYATSDGVEHGFFGTLDGNYTTFDFGGPITEPRAIDNSGLITGYAVDPDGSNVPFERFSDGSIKWVSKDGQQLAYGIGGGINGKGIFVANGLDQEGNYLSFYGKDASYTQPIAPPDFTALRPRGINHSKDVAGFYGPADDGLYHGFIYQKGNASTFDYPSPDMTGTFLYGINDSSTVAGGWQDQKQRSYGFTYDPSSGTFTNLEEKHVKGGKYAQVFGINNAGLVSVNFYAADGSFIYCPRKPSKCPAGGFEVAERSFLAVPVARRGRAKTGSAALPGLPLRKGDPLGRRIEP